MLLSKQARKGEIYVDIINTVISRYATSKLPEKTPPAMAYVPFQESNPKTYSPVQALDAGTVFLELNKPFYGNKCGGVKND